MAKVEGGKQTSFIGLMRTLSGLTRQKTEYDVKHAQSQLRQCWLERELDIKIPPIRTLIEAYSYYYSYIHEMMNAKGLLSLLADLRRWGMHPDRSPLFLVYFIQTLLDQKHDFSMMNIGSLQHVAAAMGRFAEYDNRPKVTGKLSVSELAKYEMGGNEQ